MDVFIVVFALVFIVGFIVRGTYRLTMQTKCPACKAAVPKSATACAACGRNIPQTT